MFTPHPSITTMGPVVRIGVAAAAVQESLLTSNTVQISQKDWAISSTKCTAADVGICNWVGVERGYLYLCIVFMHSVRWSQNGHTIFMLV